jgi:phosphoribosylformimino-5-aminoimidazole carboxamide ribotide isomerase
MGMEKLKLYFVIDLLNGRVVRGVSGEREHYKPIHLESKLDLPSSNPMEVAEFIKPKNLYVADLNRILGTGNHLNVIDKLGTFVDDLIADCGFRNHQEVESLKFSPVLGTETFDIKQLERVEKTENLVVSIDILDSVMDASLSFESWQEMVEFLNSFKLKGIIILTLKRVGTSTSLDWKLLERAIEISANPIFGGGGVKSVEDLDIAKEIGCKALLISTAVHKRKISLEVIRKGVF